MIKQILVLAVIFSVGISLLFVPSSAHACGEKEPETLLALYKNSDSIYIATFDRTVDIGITEDDEYYTMMKVRHEFSISSTLKGEPLKFLGTSEVEYRSKEVNTGNSEEDTATHEGEEVHVDDSSLKPGERVMLFTKNLPEEEGGGTIYTDFADGVKKLNSSEMPIYEKRINELNAMFADGTPDNQRIVDWLVSLIEDPITRWEGAYELLSSAQTNEWQAENEANINKKKEKGEQLEEWEIELSNNFKDPEHEYNAKMPYSKLLTEQQKELITKLVIERIKEPVDEEDDKMPVYNNRDGDSTLLELATRWGDKRLAGYLLNELQTISEESYEKFEMMDKVAGILKDKQLSALKDMFSRIYWQEGGNVAKISDIKGIYDESGMLNIYFYETPSYEELTALEKIELADDEAGRSTKTYGEIRAELVSEFISKSNLIMTTNSK